MFEEVGGTEPRIVFFEQVAKRLLTRRASEMGNADMTARCSDGRRSDSAQWCLYALVRHERRRRAAVEEEQVGYRQVAVDAFVGTSDLE